MAEAGPEIKPRPVEEFLNRALWRPLAHVLVRLLRPLPLRPEALVLLHGALGLAAAAALARGADALAATLLLAVIVLDNADGQLARVRGQVSLLGRYLDSEVDLAVHAALFYALYLRSGDALAAALGFVVMTAVLSLDFNLGELAAGRAEAPEPAPRPGAEAWLALVYRLVFGWQDRLVRRVERGLGPPPEAVLSVLANLGRGTQLTVLAVYALLGRPEAFLRFQEITFFYVLVVYTVRIWHATRFPR
ncbi:CDP-alcohol phosphatidyltransferase family protein [Oceanithermus sp.]|uniref:CDP-alcohol phosphatidyltransferase family protein n=1 Tax=Oceanithermus sp. TaxID=2268145 RepID=UPI0025F53277|nr:CDP-alcohol phosphatidyltransferase family protein [Oceanithermus sp.]